MNIADTSSTSASHQSGQGPTTSNRPLASDPTVKTSTSDAQVGAGTSLLDNSDFVSKIADLVSKRIGQPLPSTSTAAFRPNNPNWKFYEKAEPTVTSEVEVAKTTPPIHYSNIIRQNDLNDVYDENALLKKVPKPFKKKALLLLKIFDERPNELTWDSSGNIYVDEQSIPNSNIFELFPYLFRKRIPKSLTGLPDFVAKLQKMGLSHLIYCTIGTGKTPKPKTESVPKSDPSGSNWWFLGS